VITCNSCGRPNPADLSRCQYCGAALSGQSSGNLRTNAQEQIPAWLESLKANERPAPLASGQPGFVLSDLVDQDALPGWMRPESAELASNFDSNKHPAVRPAWMSGPNTDSSGAGMITPGSLSAGSLIDANALPSWMQPAQAGQPQSLSASSLVEPDSLPGWLTGQPSLPAQFSHMSQPSQPLQPPAQALQPPAFPVSAPPVQGNSINQANPAIWQGPSNFSQDTTGQAGTGISGPSLLDMNALPPWLREDGQQGQLSQYGQPGQYGQYGQQPVNQSGAAAGSALSAGSLIDMNALPEWLRTADQAPPASSRIPAGGSGPYGTQGAPPRAESMRVPSRPRAEMAPLEQSEVAANVFSSLLGVASASPAYPGPQGGQYPAAQQAFQVMLPVSPQAPGQIQPYPPPVASPFMPPGEQVGQPVSPLSPAYGGMAPTPPAQGYSPDAFGGVYQGPMPPNALQGQPGRGQFPASEPTGTKTARRGFLETIRGWFHS
jgi:hypothetical protein